MVLLTARSAIVAVMTLAATLFSGCSHVSYLWQAGVGQLSLYSHERAIDEVIADPRTKDDVREKLRWIPEIKAFVESELGAKATSNYRSYVQLDRPYVIWSITAAKPWALELKQWSFPLVGAFPYLGFFKEQTAREWLARFSGEGWDTSVRGVGAYSTLGYLRDPMLSSMLTRRKEDLVNLIFHETAHTQVYLKGEVAFNEQAASFVGDYGERLWLVKNFGENSFEVRDWAGARDDRRTWGALLRAFADELKRFYAESGAMPEPERVTRKKALFQSFHHTVEAASWKVNAKGYSRVGNTVTNNADLLALLTYEDDQALFDLLNEKCEGRLKDALRGLKRFASNWKRSEGVTPQAALRSTLVQAGRGFCLDLD